MAAANTKLNLNIFLFFLIFVAAFSAQVANESKSGLGQNQTWRDSHFILLKIQILPLIALDASLSHLQGMTEATLAPLTSHS